MPFIYSTRTWKNFLAMLKRTVVRINRGLDWVEANRFIRTDKKKFIGSNESRDLDWVGEVSTKWTGVWMSREVLGALEEVLSRKVVFFLNQKIPTTYCAERILIPSFSFPYFAEILFIKTIFHSRDYSDIKILDWVDLNRLSRFESTQSVFHRLSRLSSTQSRASIYSNLQPVRP